MRNFKALDWSLSLSVIFGCLLTVIAACGEASGPLGAPNVIEVPTVSSVILTLAQPTLALGQSTQATVVAISTDGSHVSGSIAFTSQNPSIATVSSKGIVTAVAAGVALIHASLAGREATASVTVQSVKSTVAAVAVTLDSSSLTVGHTAKATAVAKDATGASITGEPVTWVSSSPTIATVSATGSVVAVAAGSAIIKGTIAGTSGSTSLTVVQVADSTVLITDSSFLVSHDFNDSTMGPFTNPWGIDLDFPFDSTHLSRVARFHYAGTNQDRNRALSYVKTSGIKFGQTIYFRGDLYFPPGTDLSVGQRKLLYWQRHLDAKYGPSGGPTFANIVVMFGSSLKWNGISVAQDPANSVDIMTPSLATMVTDHWYTLEEQMTMNSTPLATDGIVRIWLDGVLIFEKLDMRWTNPTWDGQVFGSNVLNWNDIYFQYFDVGDQVNWSGTYDEYRYWDNVTFSSSRITP
jgi:hypothetical protein